MNKIIALSLLLLTSPAFAGTGSNNLSQSAQVLSSCRISTVENINFGVVDVLVDSEKTGSGAVRTSCTKGSYALTVNYGTNSKFFVVSNAGVGITYACRARAMANTQGTILPYVLYADNDLNQPIPTNSRIMISGGRYEKTPCTLSAAWQNVVFTTPGEQSVRLYGKVAVNNTVNAGTYTDTLTIGLTF